MARIFLSQTEAEEWGLVKPKHFNFNKMKEKILIRVLAGIIVLLLALLISVGGPQMAGLITAISN